jgi:hypothetical protein
MLKMRVLRLAIVLLTGPALLGCGCASVQPPTPEQAYYSNAGCQHYPAADNDHWFFSCLRESWPQSK